jgi:hypothetical protein
MSSRYIFVLVALLSIFPIQSLAINGYDPAHTTPVRRQHVVPTPIRYPATAVLDPSPLFGSIETLGSAAKRDLFGLRAVPCGAGASLCPSKRLSDSFSSRL